MRRRLALCRLKDLLTYSGPDPAIQERSLVALSRVCGYRVDEPHLQIIRHQNLTQFDDRNDDLTLAPRGMGKTTIGGTVRIIAYLLRNPDIRTGIFSKTQAAAEDMLGSVVSILRTNALLIEMFGPFFSNSSRGRLGRYGSSQATILQRTDPTIKDPTLLAMGVGGQAANRHFDYTSLDDMVTERNSRTQRERRNLWSWHGSTFLGTQLPHSKCNRLGTRYYPGDAYEVLEDGGADQAHGVLHGAVLKIQAIVEDPETGEERSFYPEVFPHREAAAPAPLRSVPVRRADAAGRDRRRGPDVQLRPLPLVGRRRGRPLRSTPGEVPVLRPRGEAHGDRRLLRLLRRSASPWSRAIRGSTCSTWCASVPALPASASSCATPTICTGPWLPGSRRSPCRPGSPRSWPRRLLLPFVAVPVLVDKTLNAQPVSILVDNGHVYFPLPESSAGQRCAPLMAELAMFPDQGSEDHDDCIDALVGAVKLAMGSSWGQFGTEMGQSAGMWESLSL